MKQIIFILLVLFFGFGCEKNEDDQLIYTVPSNQNDFKFPYYLYLPEGIFYDKELTLIVEPNNSGFTSDDFSKQTEYAKGQATNDVYIGNYIARKLKYPLLVPVFPRSEKDWKIYTHALDRDVIMQKNNDLERIDIQLIAMIEDAYTKIKDLGYIINKKFLMTGFSASGTFINRFTLIHPDKVLASASGGVNGLLMLPLSEFKGEKLEYPIGINDFKLLFGKQFDSTSFKQLPQFLFMGELDENDAIPSEDAFDVAERDLIFEILGEEMLPERWNNCINIYINKEVNATIKTYKGIGHKHPEDIKKEILEFFKAHIR